MINKQSILIINSYSETRILLRQIFEQSEYDILEADSAGGALEQLRSIEPAAIVLDLVLPEGDGLGIIPMIKQRSSAPLLVLSAQDNVEERDCALNSGADDVIARAFVIGDLLARIRIAISNRIGAAGADQSVVVADVEIDLMNRRILKGGVEVHLTPKEYAVVAELARHQGQFKSHDQLLKSGWAHDHDRHIEFLRAIIRGIRSKLEPNANHPAMILYEPGAGYRLALSAAI